ncbi:ankyrin [Neocallimastix californiae]|uniref:Ankyrin n=1 Tax=Neocallimastix californiae TaxID=1754190 RepID=A0A1Y2BTG3_9FUNG|nr:ankyrin [Neocallimastix californiae]|eukprot:ORY38048.1 ankyrin [Neocallimastix californiae]
MHVENGNEAIVKYLVEHGADVNKKDNYGENSLFKACRSGNEAIVKYLVEHGANINKKDDCSKTPLFISCEKRKCRHSKIFS